jgi:hypothetical protein
MVYRLLHYSKFKLGGCALLSLSFDLGYCVPPAEYRITELPLTNAAPNVLLPKERVRA